MSFITKVIQCFMERGGAKASMQEHIHKLEESDPVLTARFAQAADTPANRETANHVIGIERWGQLKLEGLLEATPINAEYDGYRPGLDKSMNELSQQFHQTRTETIAVCNRIAQQPEIEKRSATHNDLGSLSVKGWLMYLRGHSERESARMKN